MRILTVSAFFESHGGGIEIVAGSLARAFAKHGHDSRLAAADFDPAPQCDDIRPIPLPASDPIERWTGLPLPILSRAGRLRLEQEVAAASAIVIHDSLYLSSQLAARYARKHRKPWLVVQHIGAIPYRNRLLRLAMAAANRFATVPLLEAAPLTVFISEAVRKSFSSAKWPTPPVLLFNGVDHKVFGPLSADKRRQVRNSAGMSDERRQLLFAGRFVEKKGLTALRLLASERADWDFRLVGRGPIDPTAWRLPNVHVLGRKDRTELAALYGAADALLLPSVGEGFPLVVQEAMACGLPIFCGADSGSADPGASHLLNVVDVDPNDPLITAKRFGTAIDGTSLKPDPRLSAHARAAYDWDANARWLEHQLAKLQ